MSKHFFSRSDFSTISPYFLIDFEYVLQLFTEIEYAKSQRTFLLRAYGPETERQTKFTLTCSFRKVIRMLAFLSRKEIRQFIIFQHSWYGVMASSKSFNLI